MSDHIPFEIQSEIIKRVHPVRSLIRFRSVCKQWKSLIDSSEFITHHLLNNSNTQPHHLFIRYKEDDASETNYVSVVDNDDNSFPQHKFYHTAPPNATSRLMRDSSHGLVSYIGIAKLIVVWNPSIRKSIGIVSPVDTHIVGFGVCPITSDLKIVAITSRNSAEVFTLSTRIWRRIPLNLFSTRMAFSLNQVVVEGVIHWVAFDPNEQPYHKRMFTFDLESEEFGEVALPESLGGIARVDISRFKDSLAVIDYRADDAGKIVCDVWAMLKNGATQSSFTKLFTVQHNSSYYSVIGFRKNGQPILKLNDGYNLEELQVYEPDSKHVNGLGIYGSCFDMINYTESLLLLNQSSDFIIH